MLTQQCHGAPNKINPRPFCVILCACTSGLHASFVWTETSWPDRHPGTHGEVIQICGQRSNIASNIYRAPVAACINLRENYRKRNRIHLRVCATCIHVDWVSPFTRLFSHPTALCPQTAQRLASSSKCLRASIRGNRFDKPYSTRFGSCTQRNACSMYFFDHQNACVCKTCMPQCVPAMAACYGSLLTR